MGRHYDEAPTPDELRRNFDVSQRIEEPGIPLGSFEQDVVSLAGAGIANAVIHESGLVYLSATCGGTYPMNDDPARIEHGQAPQPSPFLAIHALTLHARECDSGIPASRPQKR